MTSKKEQFYIQRIAELEEQIAELLKANAELAVPYEQLQQHLSTEQTLRQAIIDRRITQGSRSSMGRQWNARIWSVLATCKKQGRSSWQFLQDALSAYYFQTSTPSLLPQAN